MAEIEIRRFPRIVTTDSQNNSDLAVIPNQGSVNAGKVIIVDEEGNPVPTTVYTWNGGKF